MKKVLYPILAVIVFIIMQAVAGVAIFVAAAVMNPEKFSTIARSGDREALTEMMDANALSWAIIISGIITIGIIALLKMIKWEQVLDFKMIHWKDSAIALVGAAMCVFVTDVLGEVLDLPNMMEDQFIEMSNTVIGALAIGVVGPIIEEFIFREGILGYMLRGGMNKWVAISASALAFGIIHLNPAQVPFAAAVGFVMGIIYYKTGNIVVTSILHILNNCVSVWMSFSMGEAIKDFSLIEWMGGTVSAIIITIPMLALGVLLLWYFWKREKGEHFVEVVK